MRNDVPRHRTISAASVSFSARQRSGKSRARCFFFLKKTIKKAHSDHGQRKVYALFPPFGFITCLLKGIIPVQDYISQLPLAMRAFPPWCLSVWSAQEKGKFAPFPARKPHIGNANSPFTKTLTSVSKPHVFYFKVPRNLVVALEALFHETIAVQLNEVVGVQSRPPM